MILGRSLNGPAGRHIAGALASRGRSRMPHGINAPSDQLAAGIIHELTGTYGLRVPQDIAANAVIDRVQ